VYRQIESTLARTCRVPEADLGAFRAKLRHLRNLGIPNVEKVGSGSRAKFSRTDAIVIRLALEFAVYGVKPATTAAAVNGLKPTEIENILNPPRELVGKDLFFLIIDGNVEGRLVTLEVIGTLANLYSAASFAAVNMSRLARDVNDELSQQ
jgi:hypothetical protein